MAATTYTELRDILRERREQLGLTQEELTEAADLPPDFVVRFERGKAALNSATMARLLSGLGVRLYLRSTGRAA